MEQTKVHGSFVSERISKIRWIPEEHSSANRFITGSWGCSRNFLSIWKLARNFYSEDEGEYIPKCNKKVEFKGDISGLELIDNDHAVCSLSEGYLSFLTIKRSSDLDTITDVSNTGTLHSFESGSIAPCTAISVFEKDVATVGEDGRLNIVASRGLNTLRSIGNADSCSLTAVSYVNHNEVLTGNRMGVVKLFDIRSNKDSSEAQFLISCEDDKKSNSVSCICYHPTQKHIILVGSEEGSITVWDLRQQGIPASYLSAHTSSITELAFHKTQPTKLFTASENGELWQWTQNSFAINLENQMQTNESDNINPWLNGERTKSKINVTALISGISKAINSLDTNGLNVICGCDSEAIYFIENMF